jgi:hypothetical protein
LLRRLGEKRRLEPWGRVVNLFREEWFPSRLSFGKFKGRLYQEARDDVEMWLWLGIKIFEQGHTEAAKWRD